MNKKIKSAASLLLALLLFASSGCAATVKAEEDLMRGISARKVTERYDYAEMAEITDLALNLLKKCSDGKTNTLLSPLSILACLGMVLNGAESDTLAGMERALGLDRKTVNLFIYDYMANLPVSDDCKMELANSIWIRDTREFRPRQDFLQQNADYYQADAYYLPFDQETVKKVNNWCADHTDGMIKEILNRLDSDSIMLLINALVFDAKWADPYYTTDVSYDEFTKEDGTKQNASFMHSTEYRYLSDAHASGFIKNYTGQKFAFAALLPEEGMSVSDYLDTLTGEGLYRMLSDTDSYTTVYAALPKFKVAYEKSLKDVLSDMGMEKAFTPEADFSKLGEMAGGEPIYIGEVKHKTFIEVGEQGTRAGAVTMAEMKCGSAMPEDPKTVTLDRPFVYMLIDLEHNMPFFIGTVMEL